MLDNPALDVAIGLIFIYAVYSLIVTTLTELISTMLELRGNQLRRGIRRMLDDDTSIKDLSNKFLARPEIKYLGNKRAGRDKMPSYIRAKTFATTLLNVLWADNNFEGGLEDIKAKLKPRENATHKVIYNLLDEAQGDIEKFKQLSQDWFDETMERVSGWYNKWIKVITLCVGFIVALAFGLDSIDISKKLSSDKSTRLELVKAASSYSQSLQANTSLDSLETVDKIEKLSERMSNLLDETEKHSALFGEGGIEKLKTLKQWDLFQYLLGCLLTAIALSIGSPFWFDLLNKLIKLRGAGGQEDTKKKK